jgi:polysaccharide biosynthesis transport protein
MDLLVLVKVLWRKAWILVSVPLVAAFAAYLFTIDSVDTYVSTSQIATGFTINDQVQITEEKFNMRDADVKFSNLMNTMNSGLSYNLTSYKLLLHDLDPQQVPFHRPNLQLYSFTQKENELVRRLVKKKSDALSPLATSDPEFNTIRKYLEAYHYSFNDLKESIVVSRIPNTDFIQIEVASDKPTLSAYAANAFTEEFLRYHQSLKSERTGESVDFLKQLADNKKAELDAKLEIQKQLKSGNGVYGPAESSFALTQLSDLESR